MINTAISVVPVALFLGLNVIAGIHFFKRRQSASRCNVSDNLWMSMPLSAFSENDHPASFYDDVDVDPLTEAEIYVIYGRNKDAQAVLDSAVQGGRISTAQVDQFWSSRKTPGVTSANA